MRTSSMKLTSLLLSLMLASGVLAAPVPAPPTPGIPGFNPPTLGSGVVEEKAPGTMGKVNDGLKGGVKPPTEEVDPITATTEKAAGGDPNAATGLHRRIIPGFDDIAGSGTAGDATGDATSGATGKEGIDAAIADALGGAFIKRADVPPQVSSATTIADSTVDGVKKNGLNNISTPPVGKRAAGPPALSHTGINDEITRASGRSGKRSPDGPVDVTTLSNSGVAGEEAGEIVKGKKDIVGTVTSGLTRRGGPEGCVKPGDIKGGVDCVVAGVDPNEINNLNDIDASKGATPGATTGSPGFAGVSSPVSGAADGATGGVPKAGDATKIAGDATKGA